MGKHYFEFLEEEYQRLTSEVQEALKQRAMSTTATTTISSIATDAATAGIDASQVDQMFSRCYAIYQQMKAEVRKAKRTTPDLGQEFKERLHLYSIQLTALQENHQATQKEESAAQKQEITFTFSIDDSPAERASFDWRYLDASPETGESRRTGSKSTTFAERIALSWIKLLKHR